MNQFEMQKEAKEREARLKERLLQVMFPNDEIRSAMSQTQKVFLNRSAMSVGASFDCYERVIEKICSDNPDDDWNLFDLSVVLNTMETTKASDLEMALPTYLDFIRDTRAMAKKWNEMADQIKQELADQINAEQVNAKKSGKVVKMGMHKRNPKARGNA